MTSNNKKKNTSILLILIVVVASIILLNFFWMVAHPILSWAFPIIEHRGVDVYTSGAYLKFDQGEAFCEAVSTLDIVEQCTIIDFCYYDTFLRDNLYYGKMCDTYVLDLQAGENYETIKETVINIGTGSEYEGNFTLYYVGDSNGGSNQIFVALNDITSVVRCFMVTRREPPYIGEISRLLTRHTSMEWD